MLCKKKRALIQRACDLADKCHQQIYCAIYDKRLDRMTIYKSHEDFGLRNCSDIVQRNFEQQQNGFYSMGLREYVGTNFRNAVKKQRKIYESTLK